MSLALAENKTATAKESWAKPTQDLASATIQRSARAFDAALLKEGREPSLNDGISTKVYASFSANCCSHPTCHPCSPCK